MFIYQTKDVLEPSVQDTFIALKHKKSERVISCEKGMTFIMTNKQDRRLNMQNVFKRVNSANGFYMEGLNSMRSMSLTVMMKMESRYFLRKKGLQEM